MELPAISPIRLAQAFSTSQRHSGTNLTVPPAS
jgi:hypothetical protein